MKEFGAVQAEELLQSFLQTTDEAESQSLLAYLISGHAAPVIKEIIGYKMRSSFDWGRDAQESEDIYNNVVISLLTHLRATKLRREDNLIGNFRGYVATITYNACANHLREKYPQRHILKNRLRYFLTHEEGFALWESEHWVCGFTHWQATNPRPIGLSELQALRDKLLLSLSASGRVEELHRAKLKELLTAIFNHLERPIEVDELVKLMAEVCGLKDPFTRVDQQTETPIQATELLEDTKVDIETEFERQVFLQKLWAEICDLPERQRVALLLNLKDAQGGSGMALFPLTGVADFRQLAQALAISAEELAKFWNDLPLDDRTIAERLTITRQQVINLRKSARERLARRLRNY
jgi:RNA polymerase sigma factor (sigma-70 family)